MEAHGKKKVQWYLDLSVNQHFFYFCFELDMINASVALTEVLGFYMELYIIYCVYTEKLTSFEWQLCPIARHSFVANDWLG